jgi:class 3 adenylate cyclase
MGVVADEPCPLPADSLLAEAATALSTTGQTAWIMDSCWRFAYVTDDARAMWVDRAGGRLGSVATGHHVFSTESLRVGANWRFGLTTPELWRSMFRSLGPLVLADTPGGRDALRSVIDAHMHDLLDEIEPNHEVAHGFRVMAMGLRDPVPSMMTATRIRDDQGRLRGTALVGTPIVPMSVLGGMVWERDLDHVARMQRFLRAGRYPAAILFADLERSSALLRSLPTKAYFNLGRRLVRAADHGVVTEGGLVGRHLGDGVVAFFPAETSGSESAAARACIATARRLRGELPRIAARSELEPDTLVVRFGLHWGSTVFIGNISTTARAEVTALGDEVNETARIEQSATGGRILASKALIEHLNAEDAAAVDVDADHMVYEQLGELDTATHKARKDAPAIAVCELWPPTPLGPIGPYGT